MGLRDRFLRPKITFTDATLAGLLGEISLRGGYSACLLATGDGLPIVSLPPELDADTASAMLALVHESVQRAQVRLAFPGVDEVTALFDNGVRLVCRYFDAAGSPFILAAMLPNGREYRFVMDSAISRVVQVLETAPAEPAPALVVT